MITNPKTEGSGIIGCKPQIGPCPNQCPECFYNDSNPYCSFDDVNIPTENEAKDKVVRMNDLHDSNIERGLVIQAVKDNHYKDFFFNTSISNFNFTVNGKLAPVVLTVNPGYHPYNTDDDFIKIDNPPANLMFVRARINLWNDKLINDICQYYSNRKVPVVLTYMRYTNSKYIPLMYYDNYGVNQGKKTHISNSYYCLSKKQEWVESLAIRESYPQVYLCGTWYSSACRYCGNCLREYFATKERIDKKENK